MSKTCQKNVTLSRQRLLGAGFERGAASVALLRFACGRRLIAAEPGRMLMEAPLVAPLLRVRTAYPITDVIAL